MGFHGFLPKTSPAGFGQSGPFEVLLGAVALCDQRQLLSPRRVPRLQDGSTVIQRVELSV